MYKAVKSRKSLTVYLNLLLPSSGWTNRTNTDNILNLTVTRRWKVWARQSVLPK